MARELDEHSTAAASALVVSTEAVAFLLDQQGQREQRQQQDQDQGPILARIQEYCGRVEAVRVVERDMRRSHGEHRAAAECDEIDHPQHHQPPPHSCLADLSLTASHTPVCDLSLFPALTTLELVGVVPSFLAPAGLAAVKPRLRFLTFQVCVN